MKTTKTTSATSKVSYYLLINAGNNTESEVNMKRPKSLRLFIIGLLKVNRKEIKASTGY